MKLIFYIIGFIVAIPIYVLIGILLIISLKDRNKPYTRTRKPYRVWLDQQQCNHRTIIGGDGLFECEDCGAKNY